MGIGMGIGMWRGRRQGCRQRGGGVIEGEIGNREGDG